MLSRVHIRLTCVLLCLPVLAACSPSAQSLRVEAPGWPDGTVLSLLHEGRVHTVSVLYGDTVNLLMPSSGNVRVRAFSPSALTFISDPLAVDSAQSYHRLSQPVMRPRFAGWRLAVALPADYAPGDGEYPFETAQQATTFIFGMDSTSDMRRAASEVHARGKEILCLAGTAEVDERYAGMLAGTGVDGVIFDISGEDIGGREQVMRAVGACHEKGMTTGIRMPVTCPPEEQRIADIAEYHAGIPAHQRPGLVVVSLVCGPETVTVSVPRLQDILQTLSRSGVPLSSVLVEFVLDGVAFRVRDDGELTPANARKGVIAGLAESMENRDMIRLRDGTVRIASRGMMYAFQDAGTVAVKAVGLINGQAAGVDGIALRYTPTGVTPRLDDFSVIRSGILAGGQ